MTTVAAAAARRARLYDPKTDDVVDGARWTGPLEAADLALVHRARGPVLDVGCGPGRHVLALAHDRKIALGIDLTRAAVELARSKGAPTIRRSVFDRVPGAGRWRTALLLDGNIGIGGDPVALLRRVASLLAPRGEILLEVEAPGARRARGTYRLEIGARAGPWFDWAPVAADGLAEIAREAALAVTEEWAVDDRWFAALQDVARNRAR
jgi:SAM-dependent methyltransferase